MIINWPISPSCFEFRSYACHYMTASVWMIEASKMHIHFGLAGVNFGLTECKKRQKLSWWAYHDPLCSAIFIPEYMRFNLRINERMRELWLSKDGGGGALLVRPPPRHWNLPRSRKHGRVHGIRPFCQKLTESGKKMEKSRKMAKTKWNFPFFTQNLHFLILAESVGEITSPWRND